MVPYPPFLFVVTLLTRPIALASITIRHADANVEREPLATPFGFKGGRVTELWQSVVLLESHDFQSVGLGTQSVLWSDAEVFARHSEAGGNALMFAVTDWAVQAAKERAFEDPIDLQDQLLNGALDFARTITRHERMRSTFALNALAPLDHAAWLLFAQERGITSFDAQIPEQYRPTLANRNDRIAFLPAVGYHDPIEEIAKLGEDGCFCVKIKLGHPGDQEEMLRRDIQRVGEIHQALSLFRTVYSETGRMAYFLDANGRYRRKDTLRRLLDGIDELGALDQVVVLEEPFPEDHEDTVFDLGVRIAADESAHTDAHARRRIEQGYQAIALKPAAKTLSMTLKIAKAAQDLDVPCFCTDLTVNPILVEWNRAVAARLPPFPGLDVNLIETNGHQHYRNWYAMQTYHPCAGAPWTRVQSGMFELGTEYYENDGGIFRPAAHYRALVQTV